MGLRQPQSKDKALPNIQRKLWLPPHQIHPLPRGQDPAHHKERCDKHPHQKQPSCQKYWTHAGYTRMLLYKNSSSRPQYITVSPELRESKRYKKNEKKKKKGKKRGLLLIKLTREIPWKHNETYFSSLPDYEFKEGAIKILKELRKAVDRNADHCNNELELLRQKLR